MESILFVSPLNKGGLNALFIVQKIPQYAAEAVEVVLHFTVNLIYASGYAECAVRKPVFGKCLLDLEQ